MTRFTRGLPAIIGASAVLALALSGCAPGSSTPQTTASQGSVSKTITSDKVTLTVWDQNVDASIDKAQSKLNSDFEAKYPNVKINRVSKSFDDLKTTLKLALSSGNPPDVIQANQGYPDMGTFVGANELRPLDDYAKLYDWTSYYPEQLLKLNTFSADGKKWQNGNLYGISQTGELVGVYYNKKVLSQLGVKPPVTLSDLESDMAAAKAAGLTPMTYGDVEKSPGIHLYGVVQAALAGQKAVTDLVSGAGGAWTDSANVQAAQTLADWSNKGYIPDGANGISRSDALAKFGKGGAAFTITGTWRAAELDAALGSDVGFTALAPSGSKSPVTTGGEGLAWAITSGTKNPDVAAAYLDYVTNAASSQVLIDSANLPAVLPKGYSPAPGTAAADVAAAYTSISANNGLVPYLDYTTPTFYGTITGAVQELTAKQITPDQFASKLQADYSAFLRENK